MIVDIQDISPFYKWKRYLSSILDDRTPIVLGLNKSDMTSNHLCTSVIDILSACRNNAIMCINSGHGVNECMNNLISIMEKNVQCYRTMTPIPIAPKDHRICFIGDNHAGKTSIVESYADSNGIDIKLDTRTQM